MVSNHIWKFCYKKLERFSFMSVTSILPVRDEKKIKNSNLSKLKSKTAIRKLSKIDIEDFY